jgi:hypothetical protein
MLVVVLNIVILVPLTSLTFFLSYNQCSLVMNNETIIERKEHEDDVLMNVETRNEFDLGRTRNMKQVFGNNLWMMWLPYPYYAVDEHTE